MILKDDILEIFNKNPWKRYTAKEVAHILGRQGNQVANVRKYLSKLVTDKILEKKIGASYVVPNVYWMEGNEK